MRVVDGGIQVTYGDQAHGRLRGKQLGYQLLANRDGDIAFVCGYAEPPPDFAAVDASAKPVTDVAPRYLPAFCRAGNNR